jgi:putative transposase
MEESFQGYRSLSHSKWDCKYHVVFIPKKRRKALFGQARRHLGEIFHALARQKECQILEGHLMPDHVHVCIAIIPKYAVASVIGFLKGKSAIAIARQLCGKERNFTGEHLWARGYAVSTVGFEIEQVRQYIRDQEEADGTGEQF